MPDPSPDSDLGDRPDAGGGVPPVMPRWVKVSAIVVVGLAVLVVVMLLLGHGPGRHSASSAAAGSGSPVGVVLSLTGPGGRG